MSRIGRKPISLPAGVEVKIEDNIITVKGPKGLLSQSIPEDIIIEQQENELLVTRPSDAKRHRAMHIDQGIGSQHGHRGHHWI